MNYDIKTAIEELREIQINLIGLKHTELQHQVGCINKMAQEISEVIEILSESEGK